MLQADFFIWSRENCIFKFTNDPQRLRFWKRNDLFLLWLTIESFSFTILLQKFDAVLWSSAMRENFSSLCCTTNFPSIKPSWTLWWVSGRHASLSRRQASSRHGLRVQLWERYTSLPPWKAHQSGRSSFLGGAPWILWVKYFNVVVNKCYEGGHFECHIAFLIKWWGKDIQGGQKWTPKGQKHGCIPQYFLLGLITFRVITIFKLKWPLTLKWPSNIKSIFHMDCLH